jgi:hypothetical protein
MNPERINAGREWSIIQIMDKRIQRLQTIAAVAEKLTDTRADEAPIWLWIANETHAAAEDLRELDRLHRAIANGDEGGSDATT